MKSILLSMALMLAMGCSWSPPPNSMVFVNNLKPGDDDSNKLMIFKLRKDKVWERIPWRDLKPGDVVKCVLPLDRGGVGGPIFYVADFPKTIYTNGEKSHSVTLIPKRMIQVIKKLEDI